MSSAATTASASAARSALDRAGAARRRRRHADRGIRRQPAWKPRARSNPARAARIARAGRHAVVRRARVPALPAAGTTQPADAEPGMVSAKVAGVVAAVRTRAVQDTPRRRHLRRTGLQDRLHRTQRGSPRCVGRPRGFVLPSRRTQHRQGHRRIAGDLATASGMATADGGAAPQGGNAERTVREHRAPHRLPG